jgi:hypothetical protein
MKMAEDIGERQTGVVFASLHEGVLHAVERLRLVPHAVKMGVRPLEIPVCRAGVRLNAMLPKDVEALSTDCGPLSTDNGPQSKDC